MFVVAGEALWDLFAADHGDGLRFEARIGGSPFNVAVGLRRLELPTALFTRISTDRLGQRLVDALADNGVSTGYLRRGPQPTTLSLVDVGQDGAPAYAFHGTGAADRAIGPEDLPDLDPAVWGLHVGSYSLVVEPVGSSLLRLVQAQKAATGGRSRLVTLDPNVRLTVEPDTDLWRRRVEAFVAASDLVKVSDEDLALLYPDSDPADTAAAWLRRGAALVIVTCGRDGARAFGGFGAVAVPGRAVAVVDTVGAGDSFMAAVAAGLADRHLTGRPHLQALAASTVTDLLDFAIRAAAVTCTRQGADLPTRSDIAAMP